MLLNSIDFPNQIVDAIQNNTLVVFAGAGASMGAPTSLPDYEKLAEAIADGTGETIKKEDSCEVFLGALRARGVDVNRQAAEILSESCIQHNKLHEAIIDVFRETEQIKIVTTNYDKMFEQVVQERGENAGIYSAPALPLGDDVKGIIHLHGIVDEPQYMVVTDEDFGRAYLTDGYASRFLVRLFDAYTVLFIGFSYNDTILRYLTRAMSRNRSPQKYILTDEKKPDWELLGINPIYFPAKSFAVMREGLQKLGSVSKNGLLDWKKQFEKIKEQPPVDFETDSEIDFCLEDTSRSRILANCILGKDWLERLDNKKVFDGCFSENGIMSEKENIWARWLCQNFIGNDDADLQVLICKHGNRMNSKLAEMLTRGVISCETLDNDYFIKWVMILDKYIQDQYVVLALVEKAVSRDIIDLAIMMYKKLFRIETKVEKKVWNLDSIEYQFDFCGEHWAAQKSWNSIKNATIEKNAYELACFPVNKINEFCSVFRLVNQTTGVQEPWEFYFYNFDGTSGRGREDTLGVLVEMFEDSCKELFGINNSGLKSFLLQMMDSSSNLIKRMALKVMRLIPAFSPSEALDLLITYNLIESSPCKDQVFLLTKDIYAKLSSEEKELLYDTIDEKMDRTHGDYELYNWYVWLQRIDNDNLRIQSTINCILSTNKFLPREHPELNMWVSEGEWIPKKSPISESELKKITYSEFVRLLSECRAKQMEERMLAYGLLDTLSSCISKEYEWTKVFVSEMIEDKNEDEVTWEHVFSGLYECSYTVAQGVEILELLSNKIEQVRDFRGFANYLWRFVQREDVRKSFSDIENSIFSTASAIWANRNPNVEMLPRIIDTTVNTVTGIILQSFVYMASCSAGTIDEKYKKVFEIALGTETTERFIAVCALAGRFNYFCSRDKEWCLKTLRPFLVSDVQEEFTSAWEGMAYFSGGLKIWTTDYLGSILVEAVKHLYWLNGEAESGFISLYVEYILIFVEKPTYRYIPEFYKYASEENRKSFIRTLQYNVRDMKETEKRNCWNKWIKRFLENRKNNKPCKLEEGEHKEIIGFVSDLDVLFEEGVNILCKGEMPSEVDNLLWYEIDEKKYAVTYPHAVAKLLIKTLGSLKHLSYERTDIRRIVQQLEGLSEKETKELHEALLRHGFDL